MLSTLVLSNENRLLIMRGSPPPLQVGEDVTSQPMSGKTIEEITTERNHAIIQAKKYTGDDIETLDTIYKDFSDDTSPLIYLSRAIADLSKADIAFFSNGWEHSRGCKIEHACAVEYGIPVIYYNKSDFVV